MVVASTEADELRAEIARLRAGLRQLRDDMRCRCGPEWTRRRLHDGSICCPTEWHDDIDRLLNPPAEPGEEFDPVVSEEWLRRLVFVGLRRGIAKFRRPRGSARMVLDGVDYFAAVSFEWQRYALGCVCYVHDWPNDSQFLGGVVVRERCTQSKARAVFDFLGLRWRETPAGK